MKKVWVITYPLSAQRRLWSNWMHAQADLSLRWAHSHFAGFVMSRLNYPIRVIIVLVNGVGKGYCNYYSYHVQTDAVAPERNSLNNAWTSKVKTWPKYFRPHFFYFMECPFKIVRRAVQRFGSKTALGDKIIDQDYLLWDLWGLVIFLLWICLYKESREGQADLLGRAVPVDHAENTVYV